LKYTLVVVGSLPVLIIYPFVQRYFVKGMLIGSIKG
jgi:ABC-type glycerol-3-phosphate transport system permease component